ncbi:hypothetical protein ACFVGM_08855 [Kitasatospora purpeofusca]|uniref:hypothetical protein n=1 Tax=Kitasatospora purpeofusca TaxID=67352 RepID=UPI0036C4AA61
MAWRNRAAPGAAVLTPALEPTDWLSSLVIYQADSAHQIAEATVMTTVYPDRPADAASGPRWPENTPVALTYGWWDDDREPWYGYVASSRVQGTDTDPRYGYAVSIPVVYTLVGPTMAMQTQHNRAWGDVTPSYIARTIAGRHALEAHVPVSGTRLDQQMQTTSDWKLLADLAERTGRRLYADGMRMWFAPRDAVMPSSDGTVPRFWQRRKPGVTDTLRAFHGTVGDTDPAGGARARISTVGLNRQTGQLSPAVVEQRRVDAQGAPVPALLAQQYTGRPAHSWREAVDLLDAATEWLWVSATGQSDGDPRLKPGSVVDLQGEALGSMHRGLWMVRAAVHRLDLDYLYPQRTTYTTDLVLGRSAPDGLDVAVPALLAPVAAPVLVDGRWRASRIGGS